VFPKIILNCAASADGKIALPNRKKIALSSNIDFKRVDKLRKKCDAILVGIGTIIEDNPSLTIKEKEQQTQNPIRIVLDTQFRTPKNAQVLDNKSKTIIAIGQNTKINKVQNAEIIRCGDEEIDLPRLLSKLKEKGIKTLLVEGGETVMWSFLKNSLFDEFYIFISNIIVGGKHTPTIAGGEGNTDLNTILKLQLQSVDKVNNGVLIKYVPAK